MALRLSQLDGRNGFRIGGIDDGDLSGFSVAGAGDVNGDGVDDLIVGALGADRGRKDYTGESYVVFGSVEGFDASLDLAALDRANGFRLNGIDADDRSGASVAGAGDFNGDGFDDLIIGAPGADPEGEDRAGESYVVFGSASGLAPSLDLSALDGANGFRIEGIDQCDYSGAPVAGAGDVNGDGFDDLIIGAQGADPEGQTWAGESYVVFGSSGGFSPSLDIAALDGANGFRLEGAGAYDYSAISVAGAGDVNGDGIDDLIVGTRYAGESYVVFGSSAGFAPNFALSALNGENGFRLVGNSGRSVAGAGDVNGDGIDDLIIGDPFAIVDGGNFRGEIHVVFGSTTGFAPSLDLAALDGGNGFRIEGIDADDDTGSSVAGAGDFNGDGFDDLIIGVPGADRGGRDDAGGSYVVFGSAAGFPASLDLADLEEAEGFRLVGINAYDRSGRAVAGAGDVNGDGFDDLIIGAPGADPDAGESYVVFGYRHAIKGGPDADELAGTALADRVFGRGGDDVLDGGEGRDRLKGGRGDDRLDGGAGRDRINGGLGDDRLTGGAGDDVFVFRSAFGSDRIGDFDADARGTQDRINLRGLGITEAGFADAVTITDLGEDMEVAVEGHGTILFEDVSGAGEVVLDSSDFLLLA